MSDLFDRLERDLLKHLGPVRPRMDFDEADDVPPPAPEPEDAAA